MACGWLCGRSDKSRAVEPAPTSPPSPIARPALRSSPPTRTVAAVPAVIKSPIPIRPLSGGGNRTPSEILELEESVSNLPTRMRVRRSPKLGHITEEGSSVGGDSPKREVEGKRKGSVGSIVPSRPISPIALAASRPSSPGPASSALPNSSKPPSLSSRPNSPPPRTPSRPISPITVSTSRRGSLAKNTDDRTFSASTSMDSFHTALETASIPEEEDLHPPRSVV